MNKKDLAKELHGSKYPFRISSELRKKMADIGLVLIYGASDDLMEFDGFIYDEVGVYDGGTIYVCPEGVIHNKDCIEEDQELEDWIKNNKNSKPIEAIWDENNISWQYKTEIPHVTFDIVEDEGVYCRAIIFEINAFKLIDVIKKLKSF